MLVSANGFSMVANYLIYFILGRFLFGPEMLGVYSVVVLLVSVIEMVLVTAVQNGVSKFVSEKPESVQQVRVNALKIMTAIDVVLFLVYFAGSGLIAAFFGDATLTPYIQLAAFLFLLHPILSVFMGCLNGLQRFKSQAVLRSFYAFLKLVLITALAFIGFGVAGAILGFVAASFTAMLAGFFITRGHAVKAEPGFDYRRFISFMAPLFLFSIVTNLLVSIDLFALKALSGSQGSLLSGYYTAAATIARIFPMVISAVAFAVFPLVSATTFKENKQKTGFYIRNTVRYCLLVVAPIALLFASTPKELISLIYPAAYLPGAAVLPALCIAFAAYTLFIVLTTIIAACNMPKTATAVSFAGLALAGLLNFLLVPKMLMEGAAMATLAGCAFGLVLSAGVVLYKCKALVAAKSFLRIATGAFLVYAISINWNASGFLLIAKYAVLLLVYAIALFAIRELSKRDLRVFLNMVR